MQSVLQKKREAPLSSNINFLSTLIKYGYNLYLLPDSVRRTAFATDRRAPYSDRSPLSNAGKHLGLGIFRDIVSDFEIAERT